MSGGKPQVCRNTEQNRPNLSAIGNRLSITVAAVPEVYCGNSTDYAYRPVGVGDTSCHRCVSVAVKSTAVRSVIAREGKQHPAVDHDRAPDTHRIVSGQTVALKGHTRLRQRGALSDGCSLSPDLLCTQERNVFGGLYCASAALCVYMVAVAGARLFRYSRKSRREG